MKSISILLVAIVWLMVGCASMSRVVEPTPQARMCLNLIQTGQMAITPFDQPRSIAYEQNGMTLAQFVQTEFLTRSNGKDLPLNIAIVVRDNKNIEKTIEREESFKLKGRINQRTAMESGKQIGALFLMSGMICDLTTQTFPNRIIEGNITVHVNWYVMETGEVIWGDEVMASSRGIYNSNNELKMDLFREVAKKIVAKFYSHEES